MNQMKKNFSSNRPKKQLEIHLKSSTPVLDNFGRDLTNMASDDKLRPNCW